MTGCVCWSEERGGNDEGLYRVRGEGRRRAGVGATMVVE